MKYFFAHEPVIAIGFLSESSSVWSLEESADYYYLYGMLDQQVGQVHLIQIDLNSHFSSFHGFFYVAFILDLH